MSGHSILYIGRGEFATDYLNELQSLPCCTYLEGQYGIDGLCMGVPVKLGAGGVEEIIEIKLTDEEKAALSRSAASVRELVEVMRKNQASEAKAS